MRTAQQVFTTATVTQSTLRLHVSAHTNKTKIHVYLQFSPTV